MAIAPTPARPPTVDPETGRLRPLTNEEREARSTGLTQVLAEIDRAADAEPPDAWADVFRGIDEGRPERPLFEGMY